MKRNRPWLLIILLLFITLIGADAQKTKSQKDTKKPAVQTSKTQKSGTQKSKEPVKKSAVQKTKVQDPVKKPATKNENSSVKAEDGNTGPDEKKVRDIVAFLEYVLNTIGSSNTPSRDKDVLITESYSKIFRDAKVQVEDDLDEEREVITNKDVVAYLKDVDFFFTDAKFEFLIEEIKNSTMANGQLFYKVSLSRNLKGTTAEGVPVNTTVPRYIEINYNPQDQDLKIVSIYTNEFDERRALNNWWKELSYEWKTIFKRKLFAGKGTVNLPDSLQLNDIKNITAIEELDLSNNAYIQNIEPLAQLPSLKLLNLSGTNVVDLTPIRNLTELVELDLSNTKIKDLSPLKYANKLVRLNINKTQVLDIAVIEKMTGLKNLELGDTYVNNFESISNLTSLLHLNLEGTLISNLAPIQNLTELIELNISSTLIQELGSLKALKYLTILDIDSTRTRQLTPLSGLEKLRELHANYTLISDLQPLQKLSHLERIYCDHTAISRDKADAFMVANPMVLVVYDSKDLKAWWTTLSPEWQNVLRKTTSINLSSDGANRDPSKEELAKVTNLDSINLSDNHSIYDLEPLRKLLKLKVILANKTSIKDISPLQDHREIAYLDISDTEVNDLFVARQFSKLKELRADRSKIQNIDAVYGLKALERLYVDQTFVIDINAREFLEKNPTCLVVHKTNHLNRWWRNLSGDWKDVFRTQMDEDTVSTRENLHKLAEQEVLNFKEIPVRDLSALSEFVRLKELHFSGTAISTIPALDNIKFLKVLSATNSPIQNIDALNQFVVLEELDIANTPVDDLKPIGSLDNLRKLNCSGTQIKKLDPLERLENLEVLDCSNTKVPNLNPVSNLPLKTLKCYNTKVSGRDIEKFKEKNPDCNVVYYR